MESNLVSVFFLLVIAGLLYAAFKKRIDSLSWRQRALVLASAVAVAVTPLGMGYGVAVLIMSTVLVTIT